MRFLRSLAYTALALVAGAAPAFAAVHYATPVSPYTWLESLNPATPTTLAIANANAAAGDVVYLYAGEYPSTIAPANSGSASTGWIRFVGSLSNPALVSMPAGLSINTKQRISVAGVRFRDDVLFERATMCSLSYSLVDSGGWVSHAVNSDADAAGISESLHVYSVVFRQDQSGSSKFAQKLRKTYYSTFNRCRFIKNITPATFDHRGRFLYFSSHNTWTDCRMDVEPWGSPPAGQEQFTIGIRDSSQYNTFTRDTVWLGLTSRQSRAAFMSHSGVGAYAGRTGFNVWDSCDYRAVGGLKAEQGAFSFQDAVLSATIRNSVFACADTLAMFLYGSVDYSNLDFTHNTFFSRGRSIFASDASTVTSSRFRGNAFITTKGTGCGTAWIPFSLKFIASIAGNDSNAVVTPDTSQIYRAGSCYTPRGYVVATGRDAHSSFTLDASRAVLDTAWATLDLRPKPGGPLLSPAFPDGYAGAFAVDSCGQATRPGRVSDLGVFAVTEDAITVRWTESGSDQYATNDSQTSWELRAAATPITTETEWDAAAVVATLELDTPGGVLSGYGVSGLASGETRYFAVRYTDGDDLRGCLSNTAGATAVDGTPPGRVTDLVVEGTTASSASMSWTAPGDDGAIGTAASYRVRYRTAGPIVTEADWIASTPASGLPAPSVAGTVELVSIGALTSDRTYYFAMRALDDAGNTGAISNSAIGVTPDVTAPAAVSTLAAPSATTSSITVRWTSPGDDGSVGTATQYDVRYVVGTSITNEAAFAAATTITGEPAPLTAGTVQSVTVSGLGSGTAYAFAMKTADEAGNWSALSNSVSRATLSSDVVRPAQPAIVARAWPQKADGVQVIFSAVGDDSLTGTATSYELRYRTDPGVDLAHWNDLSAGSQTFRVTASAPHVAGTPETLTVRGLRPGGVYWFAVRAVDDFANPSAISVADSAAIPARNVAPLPVPLPALYAGAGFAESEPVIRPWSGLVGDDGAAVDTAACRVVARRAVISLEPAFADSAGTYGKRISLAAIQTLRAMNPSIRVLAEPVPDASYFRFGADTANVYNYRFQQWRAARDAGGGWTAGGGFLFDFISPACFHQTRASGCVAGNTLLNTNHAYRQPGTGRFLVSDSLVAVYKRQFIERRHPDGSFVYDGVMLDLNNPDIFSEINLNWSRAGFSDSLSMDTTWVQAKHYFMRELRAAAVDAGRPDFIISGNGVSGRAYDQANGWMREGWPVQQGGNWSSNWRWTPGGQLADWYGFSAWQPGLSWLFAFACASSDSCPTYNPDSVGSRQQARYVTGTASLTGAAVTVEPSKAALAQGGGFENWWFDEWAADTITAQAMRGPAGVGYLTVPTTGIYQTAPPIWAGGDRLQGVGGFEAATLGTAWAWSYSGPSGQATAGLVTDTVATGTRAYRVRIGTRQATDWTASLTGGVYGYATSGQTVVLSFRARSSNGRPVQAHLVNKSSAARASWSNLSRSWIAADGWTQYRLVGTATATDSVTAAFWLGDTSGTVWLDDVTVHVGGSRGGSFVREYRRGVVIVNPNTYADTLTFGRATRRLRALPDKNPDVNTGELLSAGTPILVPAQDARFLLFPLDSLRPNPTSDLVATGTSSTSARLLWSAPGNDSLPCGNRGALRYEVRVASSAIASEGQWTAAAVVAQSVEPGAACDPETLDVLGLSPLTTYYFALRAYDEAGYFSAISNSDSARTVAVGSAPTAAFSASPGSGAEPLALACADLSTNTPTAWEWYVRRDADEGDPHISAEKDPAFTLGLAGTYRVTLRVSNAFGIDTAEVLVEVTCTAPAAVATISASPVTPSTVQVTYKETGDDGDTGTAGSFALRYREGSTFTEGDWATATPVTGLPLPSGAGATSGVLVAGLLESKTYAFAMKATDTGGCESALGAVAVCTTPSSEGATGARVGVQAGPLRVRVQVRGIR